MVWGLGRDRILLSLIIISCVEVEKGDYSNRSQPFHSPPTGTTCMPVCCSLRPCRGSLLLQPLSMMANSLSTFVSAILPCLTCTSGGPLIIWLPYYTVDTSLPYDVTFFRHFISWLSLYFLSRRLSGIRVRGRRARDRVWLHGCRFRCWWCHSPLFCWWQGHISVIWFIIATGRFRLRAILSFLGVSFYGDRCPIPLSFCQLLPGVFFLRGTVIHDSESSSDLSSSSLGL